MSNNKQHFDIVIAGGGLSGLLAALSLANLTKQDGSSLSIAIIEANDIEQQPELTFDARVLALSHGSVSYLQSLIDWHTLDAYAAPIKQIHISDRGHYGKARINATEHQVTALGYVVEMSRLGQALLASAKRYSNIHWFCPDSIAAIDWQKQQVTVQLNSAQQIDGQLILACDGAQSSCRQFANISSNATPYHQSAVIANVSMEKAHQNVAYERFTEMGPIAMLPLADGNSDSKKCSLVWTLTPEKAEQVVQLDDISFQQALVQAFGGWLGNVEQLGQRTCYPLHLVRANEQIYHRMVLVGNASHTIHPIAGQGFNLGVRDVAQLRDVLKQLLTQGKDIAQFSALNDYAQNRATDHQQVITLTDSLVTLFSNELPPLVAGRNIGLKVLNYCKPLKNSLVNKTMGY
ncbi:2-octaprenyl-6-methoxyphenyl hydroxylase [Thalassotalea insulae]|uniref:2-octaprenyl-6-methoxyphenyl hydroxylase n=1 Tax=Thalassotalea insulae TaxID=2056778 RepID=A0ABQ6GQQ5_9GAMM|nr:2-octaprenyl-6-methoxyphenyl hydroxylase [Thalassotalea insulae]GLX77015.1 2-octaprenyl-6-methoxyphenyl hydroxylase [Thalassotalea insulae]